MSIVHFITHPDVVIDPAVPVPDWPLSERGRARMAAALGAPWVSGIRAIHCSTEQKAIDGAAMLAGHLGLPFATHADLGENDRSATGYLPRVEFEATADLFFAHPTESIRGWDRAVDAQAQGVEDHHQGRAGHGGGGDPRAEQQSTGDQPGGGGQHRQVVGGGQQ